MTATKKLNFHKKLILRFFSSVIWRKKTIEKNKMTKDFLVSLMEEIYNSVEQLSVQKMDSSCQRNLV